MNILNIKYSNIFGKITHELVFLTFHYRSGRTPHRSSRWLLATLGEVVALRLSHCKVAHVWVNYSPSMIIHAIPVKFRKRRNENRDLLRKKRDSLWEGRKESIMRENMNKMNYSDRWVCALHMKDWLGFL